MIKKFRHLLLMTKGLSGDKKTLLQQGWCSATGSE